MKALILAVLLVLSTTVAVAAEPTSIGSVKCDDHGCTYTYNDGSTVYMTDGLANRKPFPDLTIDQVAPDGHGYVTIHEGTPNVRVPSWEEFGDPKFDWYGAQPSRPVGR